MKNVDVTSCSPALVSTLSDRTASQCSPLEKGVAFRNLELRDRISKPLYNF
jgi:hypothetical protein